MPTDLLGQEIKVGDIIAYPISVGRSAAMRIGKVVELYHPKNTYTGKVDTKTTRLKVNYVEGSMDWGLYKVDPEKMLKMWRKVLKEPAGKQWTQGEWILDAPDPMRPFLHRKGHYETIPIEKAEARKNERCLEMIAHWEKEAAKPVKIKVYHLQFPEKALVINDTYSRVTFPA